MAKVIDVIHKKTAVYGKDGRYKYVFAVEGEEVFYAYVTKSVCGTYWDLAIYTSFMRQVYQFPFERKKDCLTFIKRDFDSADYNLEAVPRIIVIR